MDAFLLTRLAAELSQEWTGASIQGAWQDLQSRLVLKLRRRAKTGFLVLSALRESPGFGLVERRPACPQRPTALASYLRAHARGGRLATVRTLPFERVLEIGVAGRGGDACLYLEATGRRGNLLVCDGRGAVRAAWRWEGHERSPLRPITPGAPYHPPPEPPGVKSPDAVTPADLTDWLAAGAALHQRILGLGPELSREISYRATCGEAWGAFRAVVDGYGSPGPVWEYPEALSALELTHVGPASASHAIGLPRAGEWLDARLQRASEDQAARTAERRERLFQERLQRRMARIQADLEQLPVPEELRARADALGAHLWAVPKGARHALVPDPAQPDRQLPLTLDPAITPGENLNRLYRQIRKAERTREALGRRLEETRSSLQAGLSAGPLPEAPAQEPGSGPYRRYVSSDGWAIWVGRNGRENDRLVREARPWDLWLHVREARGAHVLLRKPGREGRVPEQSLIEAAGVAALHSGRRNDRGVDVMVAEAARVRKPKGASPGRVVVAGERNVRVVPGAGNPRLSRGRRG